MTHTLFASPLFERSPETQPAPAPREPVEREVRPWDLGRAARMARTLMSEMSGPPSWRSWGFPLQEFRPYNTQRIGDEEAAFWLDLLGTPEHEHTLLGMDKNKLSEQDMRELTPTRELDSLLADAALLDELFSRAEDVGDYKAEHILRCRRIVTLEQIRARLPYLDVLALLLRHDTIDLLARLAPPPASARDAALAMTAEPLSRYINACFGQKEMSDLVKFVDLFPSKQAIDTLLRHHVASDSHYALYPIVLEDDDTQRRRKLIAGYLDWHRSTKYTVDEKSLASILNRDGFHEIDRLKVLLKKPKKVSNWPDYCKVLSQFDAPEATFLSAHANPPPHEDPDHFTLREGLAPCGGALALLHERGKLKEAGAQLLLRRLTLYPERERAHIETLLPLCSKTVQKRLKAEFLQETEVAPELPKKLWPPWMHELESKTGAKNVLGDTLSNTFSQISQSIHAGLHHDYRFPEHVLLGILDAHRRNDLDALTPFQESTALFDDVLYAQDVLRLLDALIDVATQNDTGDVAWLESLHHAFRHGHFGISTWTTERLAQLSSFDDAEELPPRHIVAALLPTLPNNHATNIDWHAYIEHADLLDARSQYVLDYGAEKVIMTLDGQANPSFKTSEGESFATAPKVSARHDRARANASRKLARDLTTQVRRACKAKCEDLSTAMVRQSPWTIRAWRAYLGSHPVYRLIVHTLVWRVYTPRRTFVMNVLPDEDGSFIDAKMNTHHLPDTHLITLAHPLDLSAKVRTRWLELLAEFERIQTFPQLEHEVFTRAPEHTRLITTLHTRANKLKKKTLSRNDPRFDRYYTEKGALHYMLRREISGHTMTLDFGTSWDKKILRELRFDGTPIAIPKDLRKLPAVYYSELVRFIRDRLK